MQVGNNQDIELKADVKYTIEKKLLSETLAMIEFKLVASSLF